MQVCAWLRVRVADCTLMLVYAMGYRGVGGAGGEGGLGGGGLGTPGRLGGDGTVGGATGRIAGQSHVSHACRVSVKVLHTH